MYIFLLIKQNWNEGFGYKYFQLCVQKPMVLYIKYQNTEIQIIFFLQFTKLNQLIYNKIFELLYFDFVLIIKQMSLTASRAHVLSCCAQQSSTFVGVDLNCTRNALFCLQHSPHINEQTNLLHQMIPLKTFKHNLYDAKFKMGEKVQTLVQQYQKFMNKLIDQIQELQVRKKIQLSMLWLRELAEDQEEYQNMRKIYRMDFQNLTCKDIAKVYNKIHKGLRPLSKTNQLFSLIAKQKTVSKEIVSSAAPSIYHIPLTDLQCYQGMIQILDKLNNSETAYAFIRDKVLEIQGLIQSGQVLKKALPKQLLIQGSLKQVLLQTPHSENMDISYNTIIVRKPPRRMKQTYDQDGQLVYETDRSPFTCFYSIFSKYPISKNTKYHFTVNTQYGNIMIGVCRQSMIRKLFKRHVTQTNMQGSLQEDEQYGYMPKGHQQWTFLSFSELDLIPIYNMHYQDMSLVYNCANGCIYSQGSFSTQHSSADVKDLNDFRLTMNIVESQLILTVNKNTIVARCKVPSAKNEDENLLLHILARTEGDKIVVQREIRSVVKNQKGDDIQADD